MTHKIKEGHRYVATQHQGIRKDTITNRVQAYKYLNGKKVSKTFSKIHDAIRWKNGENAISESSSKNPVYKDTEEFNGRITEKTFGDVWKTYREINNSEFEVATIENNDYLIEVFTGLMDKPMHLMTPELLDKYIKQEKEIAILKESSRCNFKRPLALLRTIFNWYQNNFSYRFVNPVLRRHFSLGVIKEVPKREKKMSGEEFLLFLKAMDEEYGDVAHTQFFLAARISEIAGLQFSSLDFEKRSIAIENVVVWGKKKKFMELKNHTKNGEIRFVHMNDTLYEIFQKRLKLKSPNSDYVFHENGEPLCYRKIQYRYNRALKKCGLAPRFSGTHIMRHSMATITRMVTGSLEYTQAITGHKDQRMVQMYASMPEKRNQEGVEQVEAHLKDLQKLVSNGEQR